MVSLHAGDRVPFAKGFGVAMTTDNFPPELPVLSYRCGKHSARCHLRDADVRAYIKSPCPKCADERQRQDEHNDHIITQHP